MWKDWQKKLEKCSCHQSWGKYLLNLGSPECKTDNQTHHHGTVKVRLSAMTGILCADRWNGDLQ